MTTKQRIFDEYTIKSMLLAGVCIGIIGGVAGWLARPNPTIIVSGITLETK